MTFDRFATPEALFLLLLIPAMALWMLLRARRSGVRFSSTAIAAGVRPSWRVRTRWLPSLIRLAALALLIVAVARPQDVSGETRSSTAGIAIEIVIDRSASMQEAMTFDGRRMNRLEAVKELCKQFIAGDGEDFAGRQDDMIGLIAFAGFADTICPLVRSHLTLLDLIERVQLAPDRPPEGGTAIGDAIALAAARLQKAEEEVSRLAQEDKEPDFTIKSKIIILLTDGRQNVGTIDAPEAAQLAADWGIKIYAIGIGESGAGRLFGIASMVDETTLKEVAAITGGKYWRARDAEAIRAVYKEIDQLEKTEIESVEHTEITERFAPFARLASILLLVELMLGAFVYRRVP